MKHTRRRPPPGGAPRAVRSGPPPGRFTYHAEFLPEYVTTVLISLANTWIVVATEGERLFSGENPHYVPATVAYFFVMLFLLWLTVEIRLRHAPVAVTDAGIERTFLWYTLVSHHLEDIDHVEERRGHFFGRSARFLLICMRSTETVEVSDFIRDYDRLRDWVVARVGGDLWNAEPLAAADYDKLARAAKARDVQPARQKVDLLQRRVPLRLVGLVPVWVVDFLMTIAMIHRWFEDKGVLSELVIYSAPLGLALSAVVARYTYYYIFSTAGMRKKR